MIVAPALRPVVGGRVAGRDVIPGEGQWNPALGDWLTASVRPPALARARFLSRPAAMSDKLDSVTVLFGPDAPAADARAAAGFARAGAEVRVLQGARHWEQARPGDPLHDQAVRGVHAARRRPAAGLAARRARRAGGERVSRPSRAPACARRRTAGPWSLFDGARLGRALPRPRAAEPVRGDTPHGLPRAGRLRHRHGAPRYARPAAGPVRAGPPRGLAESAIATRWVSARRWWQARRGAGRSGGAGRRAAR